MADIQIEFIRTHAGREWRITEIKKAVRANSLLSCLVVSVLVQMFVFRRVSGLYVYLRVKWKGFVFVCEEVV